MTLVQNWIAKGKPKNETIRFGGFDDWARTMDGILKCAGVEGFRGNIDDLSEGDVESAAVTEFLTAWYEQFGVKPVEYGEFNSTGKDEGLLAMIYLKGISLPNVEPQYTHKAKTALRAWMGNHIGAPREITVPGPYGSTEVRTEVVKIVQNRDSRSRRLQYHLQVVKE